MAVYPRQRPPRDRWLVPAALGFLALAVLFAGVMLLVPRTGGPEPLASQPAAVAVPADAPSTVAPSPSARPGRSSSPAPSPKPPVDGLLVRAVATGLCLDLA